MRRVIYNFGSFHRTAMFFRELQSTAGHKEKQAMISEFSTSLGEEAKEFDKMIHFVGSRPKLGITSKMVTKYYIKKYVPATEQATAEPYLTQNGLMTALCQTEDASELSLYDINLFIRFLVARVGLGAQTEKAQKIVEIAEKISFIEGEYLLKIIDRKLTVGANTKTFTRAKEQNSEDGEEVEDIEEELMPKKKGRPRATTQAKSQVKTVGRAKVDNGGFDGCQI